MTAQHAIVSENPSRWRMRSLPREQRDTLFMLCVIGWVIAPLLWHLAPWSSLAALAALAWRGVLAWKGRSLPSKWVLLALTGGALAITFASHKTIVGSDAGVALVTMLLAVKTLEARARRDALVIFFLGFFALLCNFLYSQSLGTALAMLLGVLGLLTALINAHIPAGRPSLVSSAGLALRCIAWGTPLMLMLFVFFPRMAPLWGMPTDQVAGRTGLSGSMEVGSIAELSQDSSVAMRIRFDTDDGLPPSVAQMYFRGPVLSYLNGRTWRTRDNVVSSLSPTDPKHPAQLQTTGTPLRYEVTIEPTHRPWLVLLEATTTTPSLSNTQMLAWMTPQMQWMASAPLRDTVRLSLQAHTQFRHGPVEWHANLKQDTQLPKDKDPRTQAWGERLRALSESQGQRAVIEEVMQHLRTGGYQYTLEPGLYGNHPSDEFWFDRKQGFCEHIAAAFVVLMRSAGIPARIVTGYQGGTMNPVDGYWTIRNSDAHAWAEVWVSGEGWLRVDPTAAVSPSRIDALTRLIAPMGIMGNAVGAMFSPGFLLQLRNLWEAADNRWTQWILNYTESRQFDLLQSLRWQSPTPMELLRLCGAVIASAALLTTAWLWRSRRRRDPWNALMSYTRARLARLGWQAPEHWTPRQMASEALRRHGDEAQPLVHWLMQMEQWRYAPQGASSATLVALRRELRTLRWPPVSRGN